MDYEIKGKIMSLVDEVVTMLNDPKYQDMRKNIERLEKEWIKMGGIRKEWGTWSRPVPAPFPVIS